MKTKKEIPANRDNLETVISKGRAGVEETAKKRRRGRPKNKLPKIQCLFYMPANIVRAIDKNCVGNKSVFAEQIFKKYFDSQGIKY